MTLTSTSDSQDHRELVDVFDTQQESEALVIQGLLESAGIESLISANVGPQEVLPGVGGVKVKVSPEFAERARQLIAESRNVTESDIEAEQPATSPELS